MKGNLSQQKVNYKILQTGYRNKYPEDSLANPLAEDPTPFVLFMNTGETVAFSYKIKASIDPGQYKIFVPHIENFIQSKPVQRRCDQIRNLHHFEDFAWFTGRFDGDTLIVNF